MIRNRKKFHEGVSHNHRHGLRLDRSGAYLACPRGGSAPRNGPCACAPHHCCRSSEFLGLAVTESRGTFIRRNKLPPNETIRATGGGPSRLQSPRLVAAVAGSLGVVCAHENICAKMAWRSASWSITGHSGGV